ncbi:MAG: aldo/keto reductase [Bacteroidales bacterium]|jgi:aryl-alcohol dehydrogenase-like predicted oxidoreductase|nr:aldo/keto reductase [Bacteroidales bacterium]
MKRRSFILSTACAVPAITLFPADLSGIERKMNPGKLEKRSLGKTGEMLSMIGFGGIVVMNATPEEASAAVRHAIDCGVNYFDVAPSYGDAEIKLGPALEPYRKDVFLACKTGKRTKAEARKELEQSLINLRTDHFDLYQHHAVTTLEEVDTLLGPGGSMEAFIEARNEGKIRFIGFSAHSVEAAMALMDRFDFDTILFPFNYATWNAGNFGPQVMAKAKEKNMGILALKAMAKGPWQEGADRTGYPKCWYEPLMSTEDITMGLRFTLSHPVTAAIPPGEEMLFRQALSVSGNLKPLKKSEIQAIKEKALKGVPLFRLEAS